MQPSLCPSLNGSERPDLVILNDVAVSSGRGDPHGQAVDVWSSLYSTKSEFHHQIADALTAIMVQAEVARRKAITSQANEAEVTSSCEHIVACAKRVWQLVTDPPDSSSVRR